VEVIVVLVILAILMSIAVPALTGYISKAEDVQYRQYVHDAAVALRAVTNEAYADGEFAVNSSTYPDDLIEAGQPSSPNLRLWNVAQLSAYATGELYEFYGRVGTLMGGDVTAGSYYFVGAPTADAIHADGFRYQYSPHGTATGDPVILVTYKVDRIDIAAGAKRSSFASLFDASASYNPDAGYEIYHLINS
jgi:type II secretory pathway pseudopilin PulG